MAREPGTIHVRVEKMRQSVVWLKAQKRFIDERKLGYDVCQFFIGIILKSAKDYEKWLKSSKLSMKW